MLLISARLSDALVQISGKIARTCVIASAAMLLSANSPAVSQRIGNAETLIEVWDGDHTVTYNDPPPKELLATVPGEETSRGKAAGFGPKALATGSSSVNSENAADVYLDYSLYVAVTNPSKPYTQLVAYMTLLAQANVNTPPGGQTIPGEHESATAQLSYDYIGPSGDFVQGQLATVTETAGSGSPHQDAAGGLMDLELTVPVNTLVNMFSYAQCWGVGGDCTASSDPLITIDPSYLAANPSATLFTNQDITLARDAGSSVPEASTWAMMLAGFAVLSFAVCRARRTSMPG